ncbi:MAG: TetR/AcrR family transcriptional regulator [Ignavibacteriales bacterium]|nr:TetR/AcrR family transcriptional regulator [Ignavibacteriales bacterium]
MGIPERKEREKEHRKEEILDAAQKVFFEKGLVMATMDEIAESAELSKGTLYIYYKSKEDLYLTVMMRGMESLYEKYERIVATDYSVVKKVAMFVEVYNDFFNANRSFFRMFHFFQTPQFHKQVSDELKQTCDTQSARLWDSVIGVLKQGMEEGSIRSDLNPVEVTIILWSSATTLMLRNDSEGEVWKLRRNIDLTHTLEVSNALLLESIFTDRGRTEFAALKQR